ncbi:MAG TPA: nuclear transport factor 2 family protein [Pedococcus sp.]|jgi:ketosteroid isomerase-like protein|nr:nuclear transport factor 2 family protein [Pedococcus sp.]
MTDPLALPAAVIDHLVERTNAHDLEGLVASFAPDYVLTNPVHPARDFVGTEQVRRNWAGLFAGVPDVAIAVHGLVAHAEHVWVDMTVGGTRRDGVPVQLAGVQIFTVREGLIRSCRFYLEPVEPLGVDADGAIRETVGRP